MLVWLLLLTSSLLLGSQQVAGQIGPPQFNAQQTFQTVQWTWKDLTLVADGDKSIKRGEGLEVLYTASATATSASTAQLAGTISVTPTSNAPNSGACNTFNVGTNQLDKLQITIDGMAPISVSSGQTCNPTCTVAIPQTAITSTAMPSSMQVAAFWGGGTEDPNCPAQTFDIPWGMPTVSGDSAEVSQQVTQPSWEDMRIGNWLTEIPTTTTLLVSGNPLPTMGTGTGTAINIPSGTTGTFSWTATWKIAISDVLFCINSAQQISNTLQLKPSSRNSDTKGNAGGALSASASINIVVQGCDQPVSLAINDIFLRTQVTFQWTHSLQATGASQQMVPWGGTAIFPAKAQFQRTVTTALFNLRMSIQITNPESGPVWIQALQIQCPWTQTIVVQCGVNTVGSNNGGGVGTGFVVPAKGTFNCPVNEQVPGIWGADMTQTCTVYTQTFWSIVTQQTNLILNFNAPREWVRINDCVNWQMQCTPATGNPFWKPQVSGGPQGGNFGGGLKICGNDYTSMIPDQEANIAMGGNWVGDGSQPGACTSSVTSTCTSSISMVNTGAITQGNSGAGSGTSLQVSATPTNCAQPPPSPSPVPPPPPDQPGFFGNDRMMPAITVSVTNTYIEGTFGWTVAASVLPAAQAIVIGSTGIGTYTVQATRGNADDAQPVRYIIEGQITVQNTFDKAMPISSVNAVLGTAKVAASCPDVQGGIGPGQTLTCTYKVLYSMGPAPGQMDAEVVLPDTSVTAAAKTQAPFNFDQADVTQAVGSCGYVKMAFAANEGMALSKTRDASAAVLSVDGQAGKICASTTFEFDVSYSPALPLSCGFQPVIATVTVYPDVPEQQPIRQASAAANITVTCAGSLIDTPPPSGGLAGGVPTPPPPPPAPGGVSVTLGQVTTKPVQNIEWTLKLTPEALGGKVSKAAGESKDVNLTALYTKSVETMTGYSGQVTIQNTAGIPIQVDSVILELTDSQQRTVAQISGSCAVAEVSSSSPLVVPAGGSASCSYTLKAKVGGTVQATITALNVEDAIQSAPQPVQSLMDAGPSSGCANFVTGLGATTLVADGRLMADGLTDRPDVTQVCSTGRALVKYTIPATDAPCATYTFLAAATIIPEAGTTATPVTASATVEVELTDCTAVAPLSATLNLVRSYKARMMRWGISQQVVEPLPDNTLLFKAGRSNVVNVTLLFNRTQLPDTKVSVSGSATVSAGGVDQPVVGKSRLLVLPLCAADICNAVFVTPSCDSTVTAGEFTCRFQADRLPVASGIILPMFYSSADQSWPHLAKAVVYDPTSSSGRRTLGRCATLTDTHKLLGGPLDAAPATVTKIDEVNPLPKDPVCASSFLNTYSLEFAGISCAGSPVPYDFTSQAKATPSDSATSATVASMSFQVKC